MDLQASPGRVCVSQLVGGGVVVVRFPLEAGAVVLVYHPAAAVALKGCLEGEIVGRQDCLCGEV